MELEVCILGSSSALPMVGRHPTAQFVTLANRHFLVDCGEGTQVQLRRNHIGFARINHIFISHLHGDHFFGLLPLLSTLHLLDRQKEMHIYCPAPLKEIIQTQMKLSGAWFRFPLRFHFLKGDGKELLFEDNKVQVFSFPLDHSTPCWGFLFMEKPRQRNMKRSALKKYSIPVAEIRQIKQGSDWVDTSGKRISNEELTNAGPPTLSYAYCTDTAPVDHLNQYIQNPDLLYHESTFTEANALRAKQTKHSTARQAAEIAKHVGAKRLLLGHFSTRYDDLSELHQEAQEIFDQAILSRENHKYWLKAGQETLVCIPTTSPNPKEGEKVKTINKA